MNKYEKFQRAVSMLLAFCLMLSLLPGPALASEEEITQVTVRLQLRPIDESGNPIDGAMEAMLNGQHPVGTHAADYLCNVGENTISQWAHWPDGYLLPVQEIRFTVDSEGSVLQVSDYATIDAENGAFILQVILWENAGVECDHAYHIHYQPNPDGTHRIWCTECNTTIDEAKPCSGGTATCREQAICEFCGNLYGDLLPHSGGTATCTAPAHCDHCGTAYGDLNPGHHTGEAYYLSNGNGTHNQYYHCCGGPGTAVEESCSGGAATESQKAICAYCGEPYGDLLPSGSLTVSVSLGLWTLDTDGNRIFGDEQWLDAKLNGDRWVSNYETLYYTCYVGNNLLDFSEDSLCPEGYKLPGDITFTVDSVGRVTITGGDATLKKVGATYYFVVVLRDASEPCDHTGSSHLENQKAATCGTEGYTGDLICSQCGERLKAGEKIPATENHTGGTATCMAKAVCSDCKQAYGEKNPENHAAPTHDANHKAPTCVDAGYTGDVVCQCGTVLKTGETIPATGEHSWGQWTVTREPTVTTEGSRERSCSVCKQVETGIIPVGNHVLLPEISGQVRADTETPEPGKLVTITVTPNVGKTVEKVQVKDHKGNRISVTRNQNGTWSFCQPQGCAIVEVVLKDVLYTVTWTLDGEIYTQTQHKYGEKIALPAAPGKAQTGCTTYTFQGWDGYSADMTMPDQENLTFAAVFAQGEDHDWTVDFRWEEDGSGCTASRTCGRNAGHSQTAKAAVTSAVTTEATCTEAGVTTYTAVFSADWAENQTMKLENIAPLGHNYEGSQCDRCGEKKPIASVPMFRMYDPNSGEHFYSGSELERDFLVEAGWHYEGVGFNFPEEGAPVHRLYDPVYGEHLYTMNQKEMDKLLSWGWQYEGVAFNSAGADEVPQYRLHNPNAKRGGYHFTGSEIERDILISVGWIDEGIGWYSCKE